MSIKHCIIVSSIRLTTVSNRTIFSSKTLPAISVKTRMTKILFLLTIGSYLLYSCDKNVPLKKGDLTGYAGYEIIKSDRGLLTFTNDSTFTREGDMYIAKIFADGAPIRKWRRFGARGRFKPWLRRSSHVTVILDERSAGAK